VPDENHQAPVKLPLFIVTALIAGAASASATQALRDVRPRPARRDATAAALQEAKPLLREGDIIFISVHHALYRRIAETSQSWESHVGILFRDRSGGWTVAQSTFPVAKFTPLDQFVAPSENGRFLVRRMRAGLSAAEVARLRTTAERSVGRLYDTGFKYDSPRLYCSKFVYDAYLDATGSPVGRLETFRELFAKNPGAPLGFWRAWFLGRIPWERRCVTTASQVRADNLVTVFDTEKTGRRANRTRRNLGTPPGTHHAVREIPCRSQAADESPPLVPFVRRGWLSIKRRAVASPAMPMVAQSCACLP
jgi:hypothetical protein